MSGEHDIKAEDQQQRREHPRRPVQHGVAREQTALVLRLGPAASQQQDHHGRHCRVKHVRLSQRVERAVIKDHAGHGVDRSRLRDAVLEIALGNLVVRRVVRVAEGRQIDHCGQQKADDRRAEDARQHRIEMPERAHLSALEPLDRALAPCLVRWRLGALRLQLGRLLGQIERVLVPLPQTAQEITFFHRARAPFAYRAVFSA